MQPRPRWESAFSYERNEFSHRFRTSFINRRKTRSVVKSFVSNIWIVPAVAVFIAVFLLIVEHAHISDAGGKFLASLTYSTLIGLPTAFLLNWVGFRCSERIPRLIVLATSLVLFCTATVGCFAGAGCPSSDRNCPTWVLLA